jgi:hypothetical protein
MQIKPVDAKDYKIEQHPAVRPHEHVKLGAFATDDDKLLGVVFGDLPDKTYSWVILHQRDPVQGYLAIDAKFDLPTQSEAELSLHVHMRRMHTWLPKILRQLQYSIRGTLLKHVK